MPSPQEIPELVTELFGMSKEYLRQETIEPARNLGRLAGFGVGAGLVLAFAAMFFVLGAYALFKEVLPEGDWWLVLARFLTVVVGLAGVGLLGWRMSKA